MDPILARSPALFRAFGWYLHWYFSRSFRAVRVSRAGLPALPAGVPVVIYTNHPSWWDPALFILLSVTLLQARAGFGPMDEAALGQYGFMRRLGIFGIEPGSTRGAARFLDVSRRVLRDPSAALWITAEGHFTDPRVRPVALRPGLAHLARRNPGVAFIPMAIEYPFWNERKAEALIRFGPAAMSGDPDDVAGWTARLSAALQAEMDALAAESATRDAALFQTVLNSGSSVGGIYDLWRRGRSWAGGRRARLSHEARAE